MQEFAEELIRSTRSGHRVVQFFGHKRRKNIQIIAVLADDASSKLALTSTRINSNERYPSLSSEIPSLHLFERELAEEFGIIFDGHPWLKPVRKQAPGPGYPFFHAEGDEIHEVGVGPVHAGIIEPGHFRFICHGETVDHLEIGLGYQHRGVESLFLSQQKRPSYLLHLAESIVGDSVIGHGGAYVRVVESLSGTGVSSRVASVRTIALELERIGNHLGDLSALSGDVAYLTGNATFGAMRTVAINTSLALCGSRFGRGLLTTGGIRFDITPAVANRIRETIKILSERTELAADVLFNCASVMARFEKTGIVTRETASALGMVGLAARASGVSRDVRSDHPFEAYNQFPVHSLSLETGDVFARAFIRYVEIMQSFRIIEEIMERLEPCDMETPTGPLAPDSLVISMTEGWRGEIAHVAITDSKGNFNRYKIKDPSFHNWFGLAIAVRNNGISDFPLCNKSFNLSYCGFDL